MVKWKYELGDLLFYWIISALGFKYFWESSSLDWKFWIIALPLLIAGHAGTQYMAKKGE